MSWQMISSKVVKITKSLATKFAEMEGSPNDRVMKESILRFLENIIRNNQWRIAEWADCNCLETGKNHRINGKHGSSTFARNDINIPENALVTLSHYQADTIEDMAKLYASFDSRDSCRTAGDIVWSVAGCSEILKNLPKSILTIAASGLAYAEWEEENYKHRPLDRALLLLDNTDFCIFLTEILSGDCSHIKRSPTVAAMAKTFRKSQSMSREFWQLVRDETSPTPDCPDRILSKWLNRVSVNIGMGSRKDKEHVSAKEMLTKCIHAWNAWRKKANTSLRYNPDSKIPIAL